MSSWREHILQEFTPHVARLTLVADPDGLLFEEGILQAIQEQGVELLAIEDLVPFRYTYESQFRWRWDRGEEVDVIAVLRSAPSDLDHLPFDLLQVGRKLAFHLGDIFPNLSYSVIAALDRKDLDPLYAAQSRHAPEPLGINATKEFVLRHVFEIAPELIKQDSDLLRVLLRLHYQGRVLPVTLSERFIELLQQNNAFARWPLGTLVRDREAFFTFLQERWPVFLDRMMRPDIPVVSETAGAFGLIIEGPAHIPFDHHDTRVYIDNLFLEGILRPVAHKQAADLSKTWASVGVRIDPSEDRIRRLTGLVKNLGSSIPTETARHSDWLYFARAWAELNVLAYEPYPPIGSAMSKSIRDLQVQVDAVFEAWLSGRFAGLIKLPPTPPVMLHHLPRFLARQKDEGRNTKVALVLIDGLSMDQWLIVRNTLVERRPELRFREEAVFAWIPTITSVSRQSAFAGREPYFFPNSIHSTDKEASLWTQFWADHGMNPREVVYQKGLGDGSLGDLKEMLSHPRVAVAGLVVDKVDRIMHGMELGMAGMHNQVRQWAQQPYLTELLDLLLSGGFRIFLCSDHGNIEANGCGRPAEGAIADVRGQRVRIYSDAVLRSTVKERFPQAIEWDPVGLPDTYQVLLAPHRCAFVQERERIVTHGGASLEELIVPFVEVEQKTS